MNIYPKKCQMLFVGKRQDSPLDDVVRMTPEPLDRKSDMISENSA